MKDIESADQELKVSIINTANRFKDVKENISIMNRHIGNYKTEKDRRKI